MANPLVSVWMITYNHEKFIAKALESALMQKTDFEYEIVIGEDCSTDNTKSILIDYERKHPEKIHVVYNIKNIGAFSNAFDIALPLCRGKYLACLEGDDYWIDPYKLQKEIDFLEKNPDFGLVCTRYLTLNEKTSKFHKSEKIPGEINFDYLIKKKNRIATLTTCLRKQDVESCIQEFYNSGDGQIWRDYRLWLYVAFRSRVKFLNDITSVYRNRENSISHSNNIEGRFNFYRETLGIADFFLNKSGRKDLVSYHEINKSFLELNYALITKNRTLFRKQVVKLRSCNLSIRQRVYLFLKRLVFLQKRVIID